MTVNQKVNGGEWEPLGTFAMAPSSGHKVVLTDNANGTVIADAIKFEPDPTATTEIVMDNGGAGSSFTGTWSNNTYTGGGVYWGANYTRHLNPQDTGASYT